MERGRKQGNKEGGKEEKEEGRKVSEVLSKVTLVSKNLQVPRCVYSSTPHWNFLLKILKGNPLRTRPQCSCFKL